MTDKPTLRRTLRAARAALDPRPDILPPAEYLAHLTPNLTVASYVPVRGEADPHHLARAAVEAGCQIALPHVTSRDQPMRFLAWDTEAALAAGPFGLSQPELTAAELEPDIILTPLVGFDTARNRIGQGAGHYDRAFARFPHALRIGIAFGVQMTDSLTPDPWDVPLHAIVTEQGWR